MFKKLLLAFMLVGLASPAYATTGSYTAVVTGIFTDYSTATLGTTSTQLIGSNNSRKYLIIQNVGTVNVGCSYGTAALGTAGTITLIPQWSWVFETSFIYSGAISCIAASGSANPVTVLEGN